MPGGGIDRRALLQRTRRSPIRPRRRRVEASARNVSPEKPVERLEADAGRLVMEALLQEPSPRGKTRAEFSVHSSLPRNG